MNLFSALRERNPILYYAGLANLVGAFLMVLFMLVDDTQILGINRWIKPFKFFVSVTIYLFTFGWLAGDLPKSRFVRIFSIQIVVAMVVEITAIVIQAARGVKSHFNMESQEGGMVYSIMGLFILYNTLWTVLFTIRYFRADLRNLPGPYVLGARLGLFLFLLGSALGGYMSAQRGHTVGAPDGGPGLPLLNWSTRFGDLRIAHFFGLHGLQVLMLLGLFLATRRLTTRQKNAAVLVVFGSILIFVLWSYLEAMQGVPLISQE
ncbi:hypothetical protein [Salmonirosea aquatica]|uniref:Uncharacterized protein n=1 Tax=Salmonirosea aquatica TaxID=2654236 RepID=A0A7C9FR11_9BACT|nr:hypothetical protein [Cytophagaceae bacterium SJW1-29]